MPRPSGSRSPCRARRARDAAIYALQMWAYIVLHELPNDDPSRLERRVLVDYPIRFDRARVRLPPRRSVLQRALARPGATTALDHALVYAHWAWFVQPHLAAAWILWRHPDRFPRAATMICAVFDIGLIGYIAVPTAPPWWAAEQGRIPGMRRIMVEVGRARLGAPLVASVRFPGRKPACGHALASLRHLSDGGPHARRDRAGRGRCRLGLRRGARFRARLPGRALRRGPARRGRAGRVGPQARAARRPRAGSGGAAGAGAREAGRA